MQWGNFRRALRDLISMWKKIPQHGFMFDFGTIVLWLSQVYLYLSYNSMFHVDWTLNHWKTNKAGYGEDRMQPNTVFQRCCVFHLLDNQYHTDQVICQDARHDHTSVGISLLSRRLGSRCPCYSGRKPMKPLQNLNVLNMRQHTMNKPIVGDAKYLKQKMFHGYSQTNFLKSQYRPWVFWF